MSLHVECGTARLVGSSIMPVEIGGGLLWSETLGSAGTTGLSAPAGPADGAAAVVFTITAEVNGWIAIGPAPDANVLAFRRRIRAGATRSFLAPNGVRVAWLPG